MSERTYRLQPEADISVDSASIRAANALGAALGIVTQCRAARPLMQRQQPVIMLPTDVMKVERYFVLRLENVFVTGVSHYRRGYCAWC